MTSLRPSRRSIRSSFHLRHLDDARAIAVIKATADLAKWNAADTGGDGRGRGFGYSRYKNAGAITPRSQLFKLQTRFAFLDVYGAVDAGEVIHRDGLLNQIEGGIIQAASWTLKEKAGWTRRRFRDSLVERLSDHEIL